VRALALRTGVVDGALLERLLDPQRLAGVRALAGEDEAVAERA
jgi:hypothetical protein